MSGYFPEKVRTGLRRQLQGFGKVPPQYIDEIVDLAIHAAESAQHTLIDTIGRASDPRVAVTALGPAFSLLAHIASEQIAHLEAEANKSGKTVAHTTLRV